MQIATYASLPSKFEMKFIPSLFFGEDSDVSISASGEGGDLAVSHIRTCFSRAWVCCGTVCPVGGGVGSTGAYISEPLSSARDRHHTCNCSSSRDSTPCVAPFCYQSHAILLLLKEFWCCASS